MPTATARQPTRDRGRRRVDAILDAGAALIAERGFDAATMTEIAARSRTAIGSLYRFFPTKEALADELAQRHLAALSARLAAIEAEAPHGTGEAVADALFDLVLELGLAGSPVIALIEARSPAARRCTELRAGMIRGIAAVLRAARPALAPARAAVIAPVALQILQAIAPLAEDKADLPRRLAELRVVLRLYIGHCRA